MVGYIGVEASRGSDRVAQSVKLNQFIKTTSRVYLDVVGIMASKKESKSVESREPKTHQELGKELDLTMFHPLSPGSCFFLPNGVWIVRQLQNYLREEYERLGYDEVETPNIFKKSLWETSGHWDHYRENMFSFHCKDDDAEGDENLYSLKPMNCPSHCLIYKRSLVSYRDLPIRLADFGDLHRNELSGSLSGLLRVRKFRQDDAHIFCRQDQIEEEIVGCLQMVEKLYRLLKFDFSVALSTRPTKFIGDPSVWDEAEARLKSAIEKLDVPFELNEKDGAFYGPKIDITLKDSLGRDHQCATIQLDFSLPEKFDLHYKDTDGEMKRPVIIHRAILGSIERMFGILVEHFQGHFPLWLSPRQVRIIPISTSNEMIMKYVNRLVSDLRKNGVKKISVDDSTNQLNHKIRLAELEHWNNIAVIGVKEADHGTVNVRGKHNYDYHEYVNMLPEDISARNI